MSLASRQYWKGERRVKSIHRKGIKSTEKERKKGTYLKHAISCRTHLEPSCTVRSLDKSLRNVVSYDKETQKVVVKDGVIYVVRK